MPIEPLPEIGIDEFLDDYFLGEQLWGTAREKWRTTVPVDQRHKLFLRTWLLENTNDYDTATWVVTEVQNTVKNNILPYFINDSYEQIRINANVHNYLRDQLIRRWPEYESSPIAEVPQSTPSTPSMTPPDVSVPVYVHPDGSVHATPAPSMSGTKKTVLLAGTAILAFIFMTEAGRAVVKRIFKGK